MEIDFDLYKVFVSVATNKSVSKAAEELGVTQSAVSQSVLKLEKIFEKELFIRNRQGVLFTSFGKELFEYVNSSVKDLSLVYEKINNANNSVQSIKIGASDTITKNYIIPIIKKHYPNVHFYIEILLSYKEKILAVENGNMDFAIINDYNLPISSNLYKKQICSLEYGFFYNDKLLEINEDNIFDQTLIIKNSGTKGRIEFNKKFYALIYKFKNIIEFSHDDIIIEATKLGLGIGFCPLQYIEGKLKRIKINEDVVIKNIVIIYQQFNEIVKTFIENIIN